MCAHVWVYVCIHLAVSSSVDRWDEGTCWQSCRIIHRNICCWNTIPLFTCAGGRQYTHAFAHTVPSQHMLQQGWQTGVSKHSPFTPINRQQHTTTHTHHNTHTHTQHTTLSYNVNIKLSCGSQLLLLLVLGGKYTANSGRSWGQLSEEGRPVHIRRGGWVRRGREGRGGIEVCTYV